MPHEVSLSRAPIEVVLNKQQDCWFQIFQKHNGCQYKMDFCLRCEAERQGRVGFF